MPRFTCPRARPSRRRAGCGRRRWSVRKTGGLYEFLGGFLRSDCDYYSRSKLGVYMKILGVHLANITGGRAFANFSVIGHSSAAARRSAPPLRYLFVLLQVRQEPQLPESQQAGRGHRCSRGQRTRPPPCFTPRPARMAAAAPAGYQSNHLIFVVCIKIGNNADGPETSG